MFARFNTDFNGSEKTRYSRLMTALTDLTDCQSYLELGISEGHHFYSVCQKVKKCVGVDITDDRLVKCGEFHKMSTDDFFLMNENKFDIIFIDACHDFKNVQVDFENSLKVLNKYGIIVLDDTDPLKKEYIESSSVRGRPNTGDAYKIVDYINEKYPDLNIVTLPILLKGMSIVTRKDDRRVKEFL